MAAEQQGQHRLSPLVLACLASTWLIWGSTYLAIRFALAGFTPLVMMGTRFLAAGAVLFLFIRWRGAALPTAILWRNALVIGALMLGVGMCGTAIAEETIGSGLVVAFIAISPLVIVLLSLAYGVRPRPLELFGILVGLCGVVMLTQGAGFKGSASGLATMIVASCGWCLGSVLSQRSLPLAPGPMGFASEMLCGGALITALALLRGEPFTLDAPPAAWAAWVYLATFGSLIAFNAYMILLSRAPTSIATSYTYVNPVIAMLLGITLGGERISTWEWLSALVILTGVVILFASRSARAPG